MRRRRRRGTSSAATTHATARRVAALLALTLAAACTGPAVVDRGGPRAGGSTGSAASVAGIDPPAEDTVAHGVLVTPTGVVAPILRRDEVVTWVRTPCAAIAPVAGGTVVEQVDVVLDPGHGGPETGAVAADGLLEKEPNLAVSRGVADRLEARGTRVLLTHAGDDYQLTLRVRGEIVRALRPRAFVSIHHNAVGSDPKPGHPGSMAIRQATSAPARRLADLVYGEVVGALGAYPISWSGGEVTGPTIRNGEDGDYYGVLRYSAGTPAVISEAAFMSNPDEAALLRTDEFRRVEAGALADAITRYLGDPAAGMTDERAEDAAPLPTGPPEDAEGCVDPPLR